LLLAALSLCLASCGTKPEIPASSPAATSQHTEPPVGFPEYPPIADAKPDVTNDVLVRVPTRLKLQRTADSLSIATDAAGYETITLKVGEKMVGGTRIEEFVYEEGAPPPADDGWVATGMSDGLEDVAHEDVRRAAQGGVPVPGRTYVVKLRITLFQTDVPAQHEWMPESGRYRVLAERVVKSISKG
jgi:hypothetical protein